MLTISKPLSSGHAQAYHKEEFANARDNYYSEGDRVHGEWHGQLARQWGLKGEIDEEHFARLADGQHPLTGAQLVQHRAAMEYLNEHGEKVKTMEHRAGWDATFSAPKSVSLTALVGGDERVRMAHQESVGIALDELESYVQARIGSNHPAETTGKWIAAKFEHDSSRPVDGYAAPQLHTHVVFFNMTERETGEMRALQPRELYRSQQYATAIYRSELALRLRGLGYEIEQSSHGAPEIRGYSQEYLDASSPRRQQIKEHLSQEGLTGAEPAQIAAHRTREAKLNITHEEMQRQHRQMAKEFGNQPEQVVREAQARLQHIEIPTEDRIEKVTQQSVAYSIQKNFEREAVSDERDLMRDALRRSMGDVLVSRVRQELEREIEDRTLLRKDQDRLGPSRLFTTDEMIGLERENICLMRSGQGQYPTLVSLEMRQQVERDYQCLSNSQRVAVAEIFNSRDQITGLEGAAGSGKTTSLAAIRDTAEREGYQVQGFAPTSGAARKLQEAGIHASTLQHHLVRGGKRETEQRHFYVLDESSLASTRQINEFLRGLQPHDRVLLVGDVRQHEAVEAGRPYHQLQEAGMRTAHLDEIIRQRDPALKEAVEGLARGEVREAIGNLDRQGRVHEIENRDERLDQMAQEYARKPDGTLVISPDNESRHELNLRIHRAMQDTGQVQIDEKTVPVLEARQDLTGAERAWAERYQLDDVLRYSHGSSLLGIKAGEYSSVTDIDARQNFLTVERANGECVTYDPRRLQGVSVYRESEREFAEGDRVQFTAPSRDLQVANRELGVVVLVGSENEMTVRMDSGRLIQVDVSKHPHLDYGYALTSHSSQGQTADRVLIHVDTEQGPQLVNARMAYVAISRGRYDGQIYTNSRANLADHLSRDHSHSTAITSNQHNHQGYASLGNSAGHEQAGTAQSQGHAQGIAQGGGIGV
jgi:conjugative relaxase-like TrwC/TraI family protein